jgi:hypothetical protein
MGAYAEDIKNGRGGDACALLTDDAKAKQGQGDAAACAGFLTLARRLIGANELADYEARIGQLPITIKGDHATAPGLDGGTVSLIYSGSRWLIGSG